MRKMRKRLHGTNFCTSSTRYAPSFVRQPNGPECTQWHETHQNNSLGPNGGGLGVLIGNIPTRLRGTNFCTSSARFSPSFVRQPNVPKCTQMVRNSPKHEFSVQWVDRVHSLRTIPVQLRGTNFCTSSARFAPSFVRQPNGPKCTQMVRNAAKLDFRV